MSTDWSVPLRVGLRVAFDGDQFTIAEIEGRRLMLQRVGPPSASSGRQVDVVALLAHSSFSVLTPEGAATGWARPSGSAAESGDEEEVAERYQHVQEVLTGYRLGSAQLALEGEPRREFAPGTSMMSRYRAKAAELGVGASTVRRWVSQSAKGPEGLLAERPVSRVLDRADARWLEVARQVLEKKVPASRPVRAMVLTEIAERCAQAHGPGAVTIPGKSLGYALLEELNKGTNAFTGSTKGKRSIASRPQGVFGRLRPTRPGEYVILDTNRLDVFAMEPVTCRWVQAALTVAMDLYSRCITGLRLTPVSAKAVDVAGVLYETVYAPAGRTGAEEGLAYCGLPGTVLLPAEKLVDARGRFLLPSVAAESIVFDHDKIYVSNHVRSVCERFRIDLQPARPRTPTDKPVERWFRTLGEGLLAALPGYKGPDVYSRGEKVEQEAFFFLHELEAIIRDWIVTTYHPTMHRGLAVPEVPRLKLSPIEMFEHGITRAGPLRIPAHRDMGLEFLEVEHVPIHSYGVEIEKLRYNGPALNDFRNQHSTRRGAHAGLWEIAVDSNDISRVVYFKDPRDGSWHELEWEHAASAKAPFSREAAVYARHLAVSGASRFPDRERTLLDLLERWGAGLTANRTERRMALRLSQVDRLRLAEGTKEPQMELAALARVRAAQELDEDEADSPGGDDDLEEEVEAGIPGEWAPPDEEEYYKDAWENL
jgi:transposase InsO family protein